VADTVVVLSERDAVTLKSFLDRLRRDTEKVSTSRDFKDDSTTFLRKSTSPGYRLEVFLLPVEIPSVQRTVIFTEPYLPLAGRQRS
jgi:hypothetical protein